VLWLLVSLAFKLDRILPPHFGRQDDLALAGDRDCVSRKIRS
jgi:hypothetical protein